VERSRNANPSSMPLVAFRSPPESVARAPLPAGPRSHGQLPPMRFRSPSASSRCQAATGLGATNPRVRCPHSVSHALRALLHLAPAGLVSCRSRPWGSTLQGRFHSQNRTPSRKSLPSCGWQTTPRLPSIAHCSCRTRKRQPRVGQRR